MRLKRGSRSNGPNEVPDTPVRPWRTALTKFWAPVPWMLEAVIVLQVVLHEYVEAAVIAGLLAFDAALGFGPRPPGRRLRAGAGKRVRSLPCAADFVGDA